MKKVLFAAGLGLALLLTSSAHAQPAGKEEDALRKRAEAFVEAFNKGDARALAALFTSAADLVDQEGHHLKGRKAIEEAYQKFFAQSKGAKLFITITAVRLAKPDLALEDGLTEVLVPDSPPSAARYSNVYVKQDGQWYLESVREAIAVPPTSSEKLQDLEFLIGNWVEDVDKGGSAKFSFSWEGHKNFMVSSFDLTIKDLSIAGGTQWIGWDESVKKPRAWTFLFNGGFAESVWTRDGENRWKIAITATQRDGKKLTATNTFQKIDPDHYSFRFTARTLDGQPLPDMQEVKMKRVK
jgi:uncharacterized protein (TIGR02246 family)